MDYEFYPTPAPFTRWLFTEMKAQGRPIAGQLCEPCVGDGAIVSAAATVTNNLQWVTNDLDSRWPASFHLDARDSHLYRQIGRVDWHVGNTPFTPAIDIISHTLEHARVGVAMHLRASIHEPLKTGVRRTWMAKHEPTGILWLPRFAYQRSEKTGEWSTDSVCACWVVWLKDRHTRQFIRYAPESVIDELHAFTPTYRSRMDAVMATRRTA